MPALELTEIIAWSLIIGGVAFAVMQSRGLSAAAVTAALAAIATKTALFELV
jgi:energy-converting hydrogenase Eha subunit C